MLSKNINASTLSPEQVWDIYTSGRIDEVKVRNWWTTKRHYFLFLLAFVLGVSATLILSSSVPSQQATKMDLKQGATVIPVAAELPEMSKANLRAELNAVGILCTNVVYAQAELESAFLTAGSSKKTNNLFGMRYPGQRATTAIGLYLQGKDTIIYGTRAELRPYLKRATYAVYAHWTDSVKDYKLWQDYSFKTRSKYIEFLSRVYATEPTYAQHLQDMTDGK